MWEAGITKKGLLDLNWNDFETQAFLLEGRRIQFGKLYP
jgi:hypothetical protein